MAISGTTRSLDSIRLSLDWRMFSCMPCNLDSFQSRKSLMNSSSSLRTHFLDLRKMHYPQLKCIALCKLSTYQIVCNLSLPHNCYMGRTFSIQFHILFRKSMNQHLYNQFSCLLHLMCILLHTLLLCLEPLVNLLCNRSIIRKRQIMKECRLSLSVRPLLM